MSAPPSNDAPTLPSIVPSSAVPTADQLAARARLSEVRGEIATMHAEMARLKDDLAQLTGAYVEEMRDLLNQTMQKAIAATGADASATTSASMRATDEADDDDEQQ